MTLIQINSSPGPQRRLPPWLRRSRTNFQALHEIKIKLRKRNLHTVCESARCPNIHECFSRKAATFMILGNICSRTCGFCAVPQGHPEPLDPEEPYHIAEMAAEMDLQYVVITSVNRDELTDGGARHFAQTVSCVRKAVPKAKIEVLTPDFCGNMEALALVLDARPDVFNHNMETIERLYRQVRPQANYYRSLEVLRFAHDYTRGLTTKSGLMVGLGETEVEVHKLMNDLLEVDATVITIGQYLQPRQNRIPVKEFVTPEAFERYQKYGESAGFRAVFSGPLVRSSYMAEQVIKHYS